MSIENKWTADTPEVAPAIWTMKRHNQEIYANTENS